MKKKAPIMLGASLYYIHFRVRATGVEGCSTARFPRALAEKEAMILNSEIPAVEHTAMPAYEIVEEFGGEPRR